MRLPHSLHVRQVKRNEPVINEDYRLRLLNALKCVDRTEKANITATDDKMLARDRLNLTCFSQATAGKARNGI